MADTDTKSEKTEQTPDVQVNTDTPTAGDAGKTFTQAEVDSIVEKRLARAAKEKEKALEDERKKATMTETEKLKAAKEEAEANATKTLEAANEMFIRAEVKSIAADMGLVDGDAAYALIDRDSVELKSGKVTGVKEALEALVKTKPWIKRAEGKGGSVGAGTNPGGAPNSKTDMNAFIRKAAGRG
ncbi:MAG: DUF4355 domain-containing protein [Clostridia bacterium]|nr:DUF4355 domain-containing protein [Clostridia bacterium]